MMIEIDDDMMDACIAKAMKDNYDDFVYKKGVPRYSHDKDEEMRMVYMMREAFRLVHNHYVLHEDRIEVENP